MANRKRKRTHKMRDGSPPTRMNKKGGKGTEYTPESIDPSTPLTVRPPAEERREPPSARTFATGHLRSKKRFDAVPDRVDLRDWVYTPRLSPLPDVIVNCDTVPAVLDQGTEGACTGFALAAVINYL